MAGVDKISLCNEAIGEIPSSPIADFSENTTEAEWAARLYGPTLLFLLEQHDWKISVLRRALAEVANDRSGEWAHAYAIPEDCASELRVMPDFNSAPANVPLLAGQRLAPTIAYEFPQAILPYVFLVSGTTLYTNIPEAVLEYIGNEPGTQGFRAMFARAFVLQLAARLCMPVKQDSKRQRELLAMAADALDRAICDDFQRDPMGSRYGDFYEPEAFRAREGAAIGWGESWWETR